MRTIFSVKESAVLRRNSLMNSPRPKLVQVRSKRLVEDSLAKEQVYSETSHSNLGRARSHATRQRLLLRGKVCVTRKVFSLHYGNVQFLSCRINILGVQGREWVCQRSKGRSSFDQGLQPGRAIQIYIYIYIQSFSRRFCPKRRTRERTVKLRAIKSMV